MRTLLHAGQRDQECEPRQVPDKLVELLGGPEQGDRDFLQGPAALQDHRHMRLGLAEGDLGEGGECRPRGREVAPYRLPGSQRLEGSESPQGL